MALVLLAGCAGTTTQGMPQAPSLPKLPQQILLSSSMRAQPLPGWTVTVADLELPTGTVVRPVGNIGDRGIFLGITDEGWFLLGIDVTSGQRVFGPVRLGAAGDATDFNCFINGPPMVICARQASDPAAPSTAWVVDTSTGTLTYDGPTEAVVAGTGGRPRLEQIGDFAVAVATGAGVHGVGARGELTWFVPGDGILPTQFSEPDRDTPESTLVTQGSGGVADTVFSVVDGRVVEPDLPPDAQLGRAVVYPGGFGYEYHPVDDVSKAQVAFFDEDGVKLSEFPGDTLEVGSLDLPMISSKRSRIVVTLDGRQLLSLPPSLPAAGARLIGARFLVAIDAERIEWQQFDVDTGDAEKTCVGDSLKYYYLASDGEIAVVTGAGSPARGMDLTTCQVLWSIPGSAPNEAKEVWKVNTTLVQRTDDRLFSLVAPS
ncbi:hypothetical protein [Mycolicibacterium sp. F2034L]|uniref:hypothetical protein n=1 Tax=Mycolicibacterium sp. F2034L TaxID=2926422 RepID=UPI001FF44207|nr:hypothetical protein [Mycolicibacterium sp. F2034L]MCK0172586.1 hypothetical protein [Mycolicibacterium sp. F2034L]